MSGAFTQPDTPPGNGPFPAILHAALEEALVNAVYHRSYEERELELSEGRGTDIPQILESMRANGSVEPLFETDEQRTSFLVRLPLRPGPKVDISAKIEGSSRMEATLEKTKVEPRVVGRLTAPLVRAILTACSELKRPSELHQILGAKDRVILLYG